MWGSLIQYDKTVTNLTLEEWYILAAIFHDLIGAATRTSVLKENFITDPTPCTFDELLPPRGDS